MNILSSMPGYPEASSLMNPTHAEFTVAMSSPAFSHCPVPAFHVGARMTIDSPASAATSMYDR